MVAWFKHDIPAWMDGTEALDDGPYRAYHVICQLIYLNEGPIALNEHGIAGRCKMHILKFRKCLDHLLTVGKLTLNPDHTLDQPRANLELRKIGTNRVNAGLGGSAPRKPLKTNNTDQAALQQDQSLKTREEETTVDKIRQEKKEPRASALVDDGWPADYREQFWEPYPNKVGKPKALAKLDASRKRGVSWQALIAGLYRYIREKPPDRAWLNPETFLNQDRWDDRPAKVENGNRTGNPRTTGHDAILAAATRAAGKIVGDGTVAGAGGTAEFPERHGLERCGTSGRDGSAGRIDESDDGRKSGTNGVLEGEVIAPDKTATGLSDRRQFV